MMYILIHRHHLIYHMLYGIYRLVNALILQILIH